MKTIGMLGGMSWESTATYYRLINTGIRNALGGLNSAKIVMVSVNFHELEALMQQNHWDAIADRLSDTARRLERAGADFVMICTNTMHKVADQVEEALTVPLLHIADATAKRLMADGIGSVGLLGTRFTMEHDFYKGRLARPHGISVLVPDNPSRHVVDTIIFKELCLGKINPESRARYLDIIRKLERNGAQAVILGCTEIGMLVRPEHTPVPLFDTTEIHAEQAVGWALN